MKTAYYILGTLDSIQDMEKPKEFHDTPPSSDRRFFHDCSNKEINGKTYVITPLAEICRCFDLQVEDFLTDRMIDLLNKLKTKRGYYPVINL